MAVMDVNTTEMLDYLRSVPSGFITDTFVRLGLTGWISGLQVTNPFNRNHIAGPAVTVQYAPIRGKRASKYDLYSILRSIQPGSVVVIAGASDVGVTVGGNVTTQAQVAGAEAILLEGCIRDLADIRKLGLPVFYRKAVILRESGMEIVSVNEPVTCAGARIHAGDIVVADEDGGIVIPSEYLEEVVNNVRDVARLEMEQGELIRANGSLDDLKRILAAKKAPIKK
jgi:regulator of RNase E activity RraA